MSVTFPEAADVRGNQKAVIIDAASAPADPTAPTTTELDGGQEATFYFMAGFAPGGDQSKGSSPRRLGESATRQKLGAMTWNSPTLQYVYDPQGQPADTANLVKAALAEGNEVYIYARKAIDSETAFSTGDQLRCHHITCGAQVPQPSGDDEFAVETITQETGYVEDPFEATAA